MLRMDQVHVIRHKVVIEEHGIRQVAAETGVCRNMVRKYLRKSMPCREQLRLRSQPVWEPIEPRPQVLLTKWKPHTSLKRRLTPARVHRQLISEGYRVTTSLLRSYLRERRRQRSGKYISH